MSASRLSTAALALGVWIAVPAYGQESPQPPVLDAVRATGPIVLDGALDESSWTTAPIAEGFRQREPKEGAPPTYETQVRVVYDDQSLYVGVFARDDEPGKIINNDLKKDFNTGSSDGFRVVLDTFHDKRNAYEFAINPAGAKWDAQMTDEGRETNSNWDGVWDVATRVTETGWFAEIRIPFRTLKFATLENQIWGANFERKVRRLNEDSDWAPLPRIYDIERVSLAGMLRGLSGVRAGKNLKIKPYALSSSNTVAGRPSDGDFQGGLDVKYGVTSGLVWDFTLNTDFSQVEADEQQVNLSRITLLFPEKRDFFLENSGIFAFGAAGGFGVGGGGNGRQNGSQDMKLFFSRQIGLSPAGDAIPILGGTRLTGRTGAYSMGLLNIQQREDGPVPATNFTALRFRRDVLANSDIGVMVLNKDSAGPAWNRVAGLDANFRFGSSLTVNAYAAKTFSPGSPTQATRRDYASRVSAIYQDRVWQFAARRDGIGLQFNDEMGFVPRVGVDNTYAYFGRRFRPAALSKWLREMRPHWQFEEFTRQDGSGLESRYQDYHALITLQDGSSLEPGVNVNVEEVRAPFTINGARGVRVQPGRYAFNEYFMFWNTSGARWLSANLRAGMGDFYDGSRRSYTVGPSIRMNEHLNASVNLQVNDITLPAASYVSTLVTSRVNYNVNTRMFINALLQYSTDSHQISSNLRFNVIHHPLSDFFVVYNERRDEHTGHMIDRALVAKVTHMLSF